MERRMGGKGGGGSAQGLNGEEHQTNGLWMGGGLRDTKWRRERMEIEEWQEWF